MSISSFNVGDKVFHASRKNDKNEYVQGNVIGCKRRQFIVKFEDNDDAELCNANILWCKLNVCSTCVVHLTIFAIYITICYLYHMLE